MRNTFAAVLIAFTIGTTSTSFASALKTSDNGQIPFVFIVKRLSGFLIS